MKMEVHTGVYWYSTDPRIAANMTAVPVARVREIIQLNRKGVKPDNLLAGPANNRMERGNDLLLQNSGLDRFESKSRPREGKGKNRPYHRRNERKQK